MAGTTEKPSFLSFDVILLSLNSGTCGVVVTILQPEKCSLCPCQAHPTVCITTALVSVPIHGVGSLSQRDGAQAPASGLSASPRSSVSQSFSLQKLRLLSTCSCFQVCTRDHSPGSILEHIFLGTHVFISAGLAQRVCDSAAAVLVLPPLLPWTSSASLGQRASVLLDLLPTTPQAHLKVLCQNLRYSVGTGHLQSASLSHRGVHKGKRLLCSLQGSSPTH